MNKNCGKGNEMQRIKHVFAEMDCLRSEKPTICVKYDCKNDPEAWHVKPSPNECKPAWNFPEKRPLITYSSTSQTIVRANLIDCQPDLAFPIPGRNYCVQASNKWYRRGPECCPQPSSLAPQCPSFR